MHDGKYNFYIKHYFKYMQTINISIQTNMKKHAYIEIIIYL